MFSSSTIFECYTDNDWLCSQSSTACDLAVKVKVHNGTLGLVSTQPFRWQQFDQNQSHLPHHKNKQQKIKGNWVNFLTDLRGMLSARCLPLLTPTGQQLTLIALHYCCKAQDILRLLTTITVHWACVPVCLLNVLTPKPFTERSRNREEILI